MLGRHGGDDLLGLGSGHRAQHPLTGQMRGGTDSVCGGARTPRSKNLGRRFGVKLCDQSREPPRVEMMHRRPRGPQLNDMTPFGRQMHVAECDHILTGAGREISQTESSKHPADTDVHPDQFEARPSNPGPSNPGPSNPGKDHVRDPRQPLPDNIYHLRVEHIALHQDFGGLQRIRDRPDLEFDQIIGLVRQHKCPVQTRRVPMPETSYSGPRQQQIRRSATLYQQPVDQNCCVLPAQICREIGDAPDHAAVRIQNVPMDHPAEQEHHSRMPESRATMTSGSLHGHDDRQAGTERHGRDAHPRRAAIGGADSGLGIVEP